METSRKVAAAVIGLVIIIGLFFVAKWTGDQIRNRFLKPKAPVVVVTTTKTTPMKKDNLLGDKATTTASYSAIPSTGPNDWMYLVFALSFVSGLTFLRLTRV